MKYLDFEKRGCDFFPGDPDNQESDIGNYRITTPGAIVPLKDGRNMLLEFTCYDRHRYRTTNKRTGDLLKHPVKELVMTCAAGISTSYEGTHHNITGWWRDSNMEREFYATPRKYTEANILDYVNSIAAVHYDAIRYV